MRIPVLLYHRIDQDDNLLTVNPAKFSRQMFLLNKLGYKSLNLLELYEHITKGKKIPRKSFLLTLDDGYRDNLIYAKPILDNFGYTAVVFIVAGYIDKTIKYNKNKTTRLLSSGEIRELENSGWDIANHFYSHQPLVRMSKEEIVREVNESRKILNKVIHNNDNLDIYALPKDKINEEQRQILINNGARMIFSGKGMASSDSDKCAIPRIEIYGPTSLIKFITKIKFTNK